MWALVFIKKESWRSSKIFQCWKKLNKFEEKKLSTHLITTLSSHFLNQFVLQAAGSSTSRVHKDSGIWCSLIFLQHLPSQSIDVFWLFFSRISARKMASKHFECCCHEKGSYTAIISFQLILDWCQRQHLQRKSKAHDRRKF